MSRGKELEQLPMSNIAPGAGADKGRFNRHSLSGMERKDQPRPEDAGKSQP